MRFVALRNLIGTNFSAKIIGFDVFSDTFPDTDYEQGQAQRQHWIDTAGSSSISTDKL